jgi:predicted nucleic acid-binding protein
MNGIKFLLDTNIVIGLLKGNKAVIKLLEKSGCELSECAVSQITRMELLSYSQLEQDEEESVNHFLSSITVLLFDQAIEEVTIDYRKKNGGKLPDAIIAATALEHKLVLLTLDQNMSKHANI